MSHACLTGAIDLKGQGIPDSRALSAAVVTLCEKEESSAAFCSVEACAVGIPKSY
jgi:hypothetical protein